MDQQTIDKIQQDWIEDQVKGRTLQIGCGQKPIAGALNVDPNPSRFPWVDAMADVLDLPFPDETFDVIVSSHVLQAVKGLQRATREMWRVLKFNGLMAHVIPDHRYAPFKTNTHHVWQYMWNRFEGSDSFVDQVDSVGWYPMRWDNFIMFDWSFWVLARKVRWL